MKMVLRSMYVDPELDGALAIRAAAEGVTKAELMRRFIRDGLARPSTHMQAWFDSIQAPPAPESPASPPSQWVAKDRPRAVASSADKRKPAGKPDKRKREHQIDERVDRPVATSRKEAALSRKPGKPGKRR